MHKEENLSKIAIVLLMLLWQDFFCHLGQNSCNLSTRIFYTRKVKHSILQEQSCRARKACHLTVLLLIDPLRFRHGLLAMKVLGQATPTGSVLSRKSECAVSVRVEKFRTMGDGRWMMDDG